MWVGVGVYVYLICTNNIYYIINIPLTTEAGALILRITPNCMTFGTVDKVNLARNG